MSDTDDERLAAVLKSDPVLALVGEEGEDGDEDGEDNGEKEGERMRGMRGRKRFVFAKVHGTQHTPHTA